MLSKNQLLGSEVSIDNFNHQSTELRMNNKLDINDSNNNRQYKATGILPLHKYNVFLVFNFENTSVFAFDFNYS